MKNTPAPLSDGGATHFIGFNNQYNPAQYYKPKKEPKIQCDNNAFVAAQLSQTSYQAPFTPTSDQDATNPYAQPDHDLQAFINLPPRLRSRASSPIIQRTSTVHKQLLPEFIRMNPALYPINSETQTEPTEAECEKELREKEEFLLSSSKSLTPKEMDPYNMKENAGLIPYIRLKLSGDRGINTLEVLAMSDSGASSSLVDVLLYQELQLLEQFDFQSVNINISSAFLKKNSTVIGIVPITLHFDDEKGNILKFRHIFHIATNLSSPIFIGSDLLHCRDIVSYSTPDILVLKYPNSNAVLEVQYKFFKKKPNACLVSIDNITLPPNSLTSIPLEVLGKDNPDFEYTVLHNDHFFIQPHANFMQMNPKLKLQPTITPIKEFGSPFHVFIANNSDQERKLARGTEIAVSDNLNPFPSPEKKIPILKRNESINTASIFEHKTCFQTDMRDCYYVTQFLMDNKFHYDIVRIEGVRKVYHKFIPNFYSSNKKLVDTTFLRFPPYVIFDDSDPCAVASADEDLPREFKENINTELKKSAETVISSPSTPNLINFIPKLDSGIPQIKCLTPILPLFNSIPVLQTMIVEPEVHIPELLIDLSDTSDVPCLIPYQINAISEKYEDVLPLLLDMTQSIHDSSPPPDLPITDLPVIKACENNNDFNFDRHPTRPDSPVPPAIDYSQGYNISLMNTEEEDEVLDDDIISINDNEERNSLSDEFEDVIPSDLNLTDGFAYTTISNIQVENLYNEWKQDIEMETEMAFSYDLPFPEINTSAITDNQTVDELSMEHPIQSDHDYCAPKMLDPLTMDHQFFAPPQNNDNQFILLKDAKLRKIKTFNHNIPIKDIPPLPDDFFNDLDLSGLQPDQQKRILDLCKEFPSIWSTHQYDTGCVTFMEARIQLRKPLPKCDRRRVVNPTKAKIMTDILDLMEFYDQIERSLSVYIQNLHALKKKNGEWRVTIDARKLNDATMIQRTSPQISEHLLANLAGKPFKSSFDIRQSFHAIPIHPTSRYLTSFYHPSKPATSFQYRFLSMGLANSPATFQTCLSYLFDDCSDFISHYMDDIICHDMDFDSHYKSIRTLFTRLQVGGFKLDLAKSQICTFNLKFLGFQLTGDKVQIGDAKCQGLINIPEPTTTDEVRSFISKFAYWKRLFKGFSLIAKPIYRLMSPKVIFEWTPDCQRAFNELINVVKNDVHSYLPNRNSLFILSTDSSLAGCSALLEQYCDKTNVKRTVGAFSKLFHNAELSYSIFELESYGLLLALRHFRYYLEGLEHFVALTDSRGVAYCKKAAPLNEKFQRYLLELQEYNFSIIHIAGVSNKATDLMSRHIKGAKKREKINLSKYELDRLIQQIKIDTNTLIPMDKVKILINPDDYDCEADVSKTEIKKNYLAELAQVRKNLEESVHSVQLQPTMAFTEFYNEFSCNTTNTNSIGRDSDFSFQGQIHQNFNSITVPETSSDMELNSVQAKDANSDQIDIDNELRGPKCTINAQMTNEFNFHISQLLTINAVTACQPNINLSLLDFFDEKVDVLKKQTNLDPTNTYKRYDSENNNVNGANEEFMEDTKKLNANSDGTPNLSTHLTANSDGQPHYDSDSLETVPGFSMLNQPFFLQHFWNNRTIYPHINTVEFNLLNQAPEESAHSPVRDCAPQIHVTKVMDTEEDLDCPMPDDAVEEQDAETDVIIPRELINDKDIPLYSFSILEQGDMLVSAIIQSGTMNPKMFIELQQHDPFCQQITKQLDLKNYKTMRRFCKNKDLLLFVEHRKSIDHGDKTKEKDVRLRIVLPEVLTQPVIYSLHHSHLGAHASRSRVLQGIVSMFYKPKLYSQVRDILSKCRACKFAVFQPKSATLAAKRQISPCFPRSCVSLDLAIGLPTTKKGNTHVLVMIDHFSRFVVLAGIASKSAEDVLNAFRTHWLPTMGIPLLCRQDNELAMSSTIFTEFCAKYGIRQSNSIAYGPQGQGVNENAVKSAKAAIRSLAMMEDAKQNWDEYLWVVAGQFNAMPSRSLGGMSAERIMFQHSNINLKTHPLVLIQNSQAVPSIFKRKCEQMAYEVAHREIENNNDFTNITIENEFMQPEFLKTIQHVCSVRDAIRTQNERQFQHLVRHPKPIKVGDLVTQKHLAVGQTGGASAALSQKNHGPFLVTRVGDRRVELIHCVEGYKRITSLQFVNKYSCNDIDFMLPRNWSKDLGSRLDTLNKKPLRSSDRASESPLKLADYVRSPRISDRVKKANPKFQ